MDKHFKPKDIPNNNIIYDMREFKFNNASKTVWILAEPFNQNSTSYINLFRIEML